MPQHLQNWLPLMLKLLLWFCMAGIAYTVANTALVLISDPGASAGNPIGSVTQEKTSTLPPAPPLEQMIQRQFFGRYVQNGQPRDSGLPATPTRLPLTLEAVFLSSANEASSAIISERNKPGKLYAISDLVPGNARLVHVETDRVILQRGGTREALAFKSDFRARAGATSNQDPLASESAQPSRDSIQDLLISVANENGETLTASLANSSLPSTSVLPEKQPVPPTQSLDVLGIKASASGMYELSERANPLLLQAGLRAGDIVLSINGRSLDELMANRQTLTTLALAGRVKIEVLRQGRTMIVTSRVPESLRQ